MDREEVFSQLNGIFREVFDDGEIEVEESTTSEDIEDWDSFEQINLIVAIEEQFKIKFSLEEVAELKNVGEMADIIMDRT